MCELNGEKQRVDLVLSLYPGYSETFLVSKIRGLKESSFNVRLFLAKGVRAADVFVALPIRGQGLRDFFLTIWALCVISVLRPRRANRFIRAERKLARSFKRVVKNLALNYHLLLYGRSGWLHFEFATQAIGAESVAAAIGAKMSLSLRGYDISIYPLKNPGCYRHVWSRLVKVHSISHDLVHRADNSGLPSAVPIVLIPPAIDTSAFNSTPIEKVGSACEFLTIARLHWKKGLDYVLIALKNLCSNAPELDWHYTILGDGDLMERLAFTTAELGLENRVTLAGRASAEDTRKYLGKSDVYIQYSVQEGYCNAVVEAQAMGVICVVSDAEGLPENVQDTGFVVAKRRPTMLARRLERVIRLDERERLFLTNSARQRVMKRNDRKLQRRSFENFFNS